MEQLIGGWLIWRAVCALAFWCLGALVFRWLVVDPVVDQLRSIDESLKCMPAAREMRAARHRAGSRAA